MNEQVIGSISLFIQTRYN